VWNFKLWKMVDREAAERTGGFVSEGPKPLEKKPDEDILSGEGFSNPLEI